MINFIFFIFASKFDEVHVISQYKYKWITRAWFPSIIISFIWCPLDISVPSRNFDLSSFSYFCFENTKSLSLVITLSMEIFVFESIFRASINQFKSFSLSKLCFKWKLINLSDLFLMSHDKGINKIYFDSIIEQKKCRRDNNLIKLFVCFLDLNQLFLC